MTAALIALGSNVGDRRLTIQRALERLSVESGIELVAASSLHETTPVGGPSGQGAFLNAAARLETTLSPGELLARLRQVETEWGRQREIRWDARTLDLDLLLYGSLVVARPDLFVPHPRMAFRRFVLEPAVEVAADWVHPTIGWSLERLLAHTCQAPPYMALLGSPGSGKTRLARGLVERFGGRLIAQPSSGQGDDSSGRTLARQIQFLAAYGTLLSGPPPQGEPWVSDFHFDQSLAYARAELAADQFVQFEADWAAARAKVVLPKLVVVLDELPLEGARSSAASLLDTEIARLAARPDQVVVYVGRQGFEGQLAEAAAAIAALQAY
jgi:2-amino-4-hydroxy-6-hydroxymethyldihydropteridine diphosphokinase